MESRKAHNLEIGGSNPPPAINLLKVTLSVYRWSMARVDCNIMMLKKKVIAVKILKVTNLKSILRVFW